jgi:GNAT superfamily N-acetyltransferase
VAFIVYALPRSRTAWLSQFLSYGEWHCGHDEVRHLRGLDDVASWFSQPFTGTVETAAAPFWRTVARLTPDIKVVVVRRPVAEVVASLMKVGSFDQEALEAEMKRLDRKLEQIERRMPNVLSVKFADLADEAVCAELFEHCLPYRHDRARWELLSQLNVQINFTAEMRYFEAHKPQLAKVAQQAKAQQLIEWSRRPFREPDDLTFREEDFETFYRDAQPLFKEHSLEVGEAPDSHTTKNVELFRSLHKNGELQVITARQNGRIFGYLLSAIAPSLETPGERVGLHNLFYASPMFPGLGRRLQKAAAEALRHHGVRELVLRAGTRGSGPRLGALYRRMGAEDHGHLYLLKLKDD